MESRRGPIHDVNDTDVVTPLPEQRQQPTPQTLYAEDKASLETEAQARPA